MDNDEFDYPDEFHRMIRENEAEGFGSQKLAMQTAHGLVADALQLIIETAPAGLPGPQIWIGGLRIMSDMAACVAQVALHD